MLEIKNVSKSFGDKKVLDNFTISMNLGEILAVVGPSGGGKTTLLRCISGLEEMDTGDILIEGEKVDPQRPQEEKNRIGVVFQEFNLFPHLSVMDNLILAPVLVSEKSKAAAKTEAQTILNNLGLGDKAGNYPFQLSGGQKQRVAIARALLMKPRVLCYDEPTSALDPALRDSVAENILLLKEENVTQIIVTHDHEFAKKVADQIIEVSPIK
ncbi:amino acid ABC transporter ATP-binding protein [Vagococcus acidifermentans]|uniref:Polar amino acid ABC transporter ATP-binding protein n=1 Tax=Vagococcus acidifermentans TaxID=564710 RepID=A0A430ARD1_9ENTE|nr:amino acid ABC transporter ATP-binding protein [Vagococcus acidifermentans]RSU10614.1 polar amino acid ABC transporter ATP-binding protein [Vagococcus acidifermentans]